MDTEVLLSEIRAVFPSLPMPRAEELRFHPTNCAQCQYLSKDLEAYRGRVVDGNLLRYLHQELSCLSAKGWLWVLPNYLTYGLTPEAEYNQMETEFLIYNLAPGEQFEAETRERLSLLNPRQLACVLHFLEWLGDHPVWSERFPKELRAAKEFIGELVDV
jgi:uncharacterized protein DUF6714